MLFIERLSIIGYALCRAKHPKEEKKKKKKSKEDAALYEDIIEDLVLSSDEDEFAGNDPFVVEDAGKEAVLSKKQRKKWKLSAGSGQKNVQVDGKKQKSSTTGLSQKNVQVGWKSRKAKRKRAN